MGQKPHTPSDSIDRRGFLAGVASAAAFGAMPRGSIASPKVEPPRKLAKNLIFAVADGCGPGAVQLGELFLRMRDDRSLNWIDLIKRRDTTTSLVDTSSADGPVTDSAASASAWAIGELCNNKAISWTPDDRSPGPLFLRASDEGKAFGMVATTYIWDATPVAWVANAPGRKQWRDIAEQLIESKPTVALGGGALAFPEEVLALDPTLRVLRDRASLLASAGDPSRLLGLFAPETFPYKTEYDERTPTLSEMTDVALRRLRDASPDGFCLVVEGAKIDHAAHRNDAGSLVNELVHFDETLGSLIDFADEDGETLLVVTSDHSNANPALTLYAEKGVRAFENVLKHRQSLEWAVTQLSPHPEYRRDPDEMFDLLQKASGLELNKRDYGLLKRYAEGQPIDGFTTNDRLYSLFGSILASYTGVAFLSPNHTTDPVTATALGPGHELFSPWMRIDEIHHCLVAAMGLPALG